MRIRSIVFVLAAVGLVAGCGGGAGKGAAPPTSAPATTTASASATPPTPTGPAAARLVVSSPAFRDGAAIPTRYACAPRGRNVAPPLAWVGGPRDVTAWAVVMDDPDAVGGLFVHWILADIPAAVHELGEGVTPPGALLAPNQAGKAAYLGPCPPAGSGVHHYRFTLYALRAKTEVSAATPMAQALAAIRRNAVAQARTTGTFTAP